MHPLERLRFVARAGIDSPGAAAVEALGALRGMAADPASLVTGCRRLLARQPWCGPLWWSSARLLASPDPAREALLVATELESDPTVDLLAAAFDPGAAATVLGWPEQVVGALHLRPDVEAICVDTGEGGADLAGWLADGGGRARCVPGAAVASAALDAQVVLVEALAAGPDAVLAGTGSRAAAAVAADAGVGVWAVLPRGRVLPAGLWASLVSLLEAGDTRFEVVPARHISRGIDDVGSGAGLAALGRGACPDVPDLAGWRHQAGRG